jgi:hypothetical protein
MPATAQYHVVIDGQGYLVDLDTYRRAISQASIFASKTRAGDASYGDLSQQNVWAQQDWRGGFGYPEWDPNNPTRFADGKGIDTSFGDLRLGRTQTSVFNPATNDIYGLAVYEGNIYAISGSSGLIWRSTNGGVTWSQHHDTTRASLRSIALFAGLLVVGSGDSGELFRWNGTDWASYFTISGSPTAIRSLFTWFRTANATELYAGCSLTATTAKLVRLSTTPAETLIANVYLPKIDAIGANDGKLYFCALDDTSGVRGEVFTFDGSNTRSVTSLPDNAITSFTEYQNQLWAGSRTRGKIWTVATTGLTEQFSIPEVAMSGSPPDFTDAIRSLVVDRGRLYFPAVDVQGLSLYQYDGNGWCRITSGGSGEEARALAAFNNELFVTTGDVNPFIYRVAQTYPTSGELITGWFDAELGSIEKGFVRLTLAHAPLAAGETIAVHYALDDATTWTSLGTSDVDGAGTASFTFPAQTKGRRIRFRFTLSLTTNTATPRLRDAILEYQLSSLSGTTIKSEWSFEALLEGTSELPLIRLDQSAETQTGGQLSAALWTSRGKAGAISFTDIAAVARTVYFLDLTESPAPRSDRLGLSTRGKVRLVEA